MPDQLELRLPRRVAVVLQPQYSLTALASILDVLLAANRISGTALYAPVVVGAQVRAIQSIEGVEITPDAVLSALRQPSMVFVLGPPDERAPSELVEWLEGLARRGVATFGADIEADTTGVTEERSGAPPADPPWPYQRAVMFERVCELIAAEHGAKLAREVTEAQIMQGQLPADEAQAIARMTWIKSQAPRLATAIKLMQANVETPLKLPEVARRVGLSMRQLERLSQEHLGSAPHAYYLQVRLSHADFLLHESRCSLEQIAFAIGFRSLGYFSRRYREQFGRTPRAVQRELGPRSQRGR